ncbi:YbaB/EbfC family nucleoid-associated protein [Nocardia brasiliensis]|uniref:YbaB/EbfC family nucleoid-associated protein n=1 Tax=Nocardia brasiliensis TaxID=37326 RepID=UPI0024558AE6|nr:YbaB/EbfC family nucleoid-associated protein [Nocardia brasiliensis]
MTGSNAGSPADEMLRLLERQARDLTAVLAAAQSVEAEATDRRRAITVRVTADGVVRQVTIHPAGAALNHHELGELFVATTNQAFAQARSVADARMSEFHELRRQLADHMVAGNTAAGETFSTLTATLTGKVSPADAVPADEDPAPRPWSVFDT